MKPWVILPGRVFYSLIFIVASLNHFSRTTIAFASSHNVPMASVLVPLSGVLAFAGGVSILLGYKARWGAGMLIVFLIPVTAMMHNFWTVADPFAHEIQVTMFLKNLSMLGGAIELLYYGAGPLSLDNLCGLARAPGQRGGSVNGGYI